MTRYVYSPFVPVADRYLTSHRAGWAMYWAHVLSAKLITTKDMDSFLDRVDSRHDQVYVYHGMEFRDALNFPGGMPDVMLSRAEMLTQLGTMLGKRLFSLDREMPDYAHLMAKQTKKEWPRLAEALKKSSTTAWPNTASRELIIGDSHSLSQYANWGRIYRTDGLTLHGALSRGLVEMVDFSSKGVDQVDALRFYFGNIDVRHHLARYEPSEVKRLVQEYLRQVGEVTRKYRKAIVTIVAPLPIENESRVLPQTGWYKGTPFFGSWEQRNSIRLAMTEFMKKMGSKQGVKVALPPLSFLNEKMELSFDVMEKPRSVHIAPAYYRHILEGGKWDF